MSGQWCKPQSTLVGVWLWRCCSLSMEHNMQMGKVGRTASDRMPCVVYKHICIDRGLLSRAPLLFWFSDVFMSLSSSQPIKALSSTPPTSPFWLVQVYPYSFCGLLQRLSWFFFLLLLAPWRAKSWRQQWGIGYLAVRYYDSSGVAARMPRQLLQAWTV